MNVGESTTPGVGLLTGHPVSATVRVSVTVCEPLYLPSPRHTGGAKAAVVILYTAALKLRKSKRDKNMTHVYWYQNIWDIFHAVLSLTVSIYGRDKEPLPPLTPHPSVLVCMCVSHYMYHIARGINPTLSHSCRTAVASLAQTM